MNEITTTRPTAIGPAVLEKLKMGIAQSRASTVIAGGKPLMRLLKDAKWVFGQKDSPVQENSSWAINPLSLGHGWVAWTNHEGNTKNTMVGENMVPIHEDKPIRPAPVDGWPFNEQRMFEMRCVDGDDAGQEVLYKTASYGGMQAVDALLGKIQAQLDSNPQYPCAVVILMSESYPHPKWGKVYNPVFDIVDWATMDGKLMSEAGEAQAEPEPEPEPEPVKAAPVPKPRLAPRGAAAAPAPAAAPEAPEPTARRRPVKRG